MAADKTHHHFSIFFFSFFDLESDHPKALSTPSGEHTHSLNVYPGEIHSHSMSHLFSL
jgi:hypothetical protein